MSENQIITQLTPEQEALIPLYREKWRNIALSTERIEREKAAEAVKAAYALISLPEPEILFYDSPYAALKALDNFNYIRLDTSDLLSQVQMIVFKDFWKQRKERRNNKLREKPIYIKLRKIIQELHYEQQQKLFWIMYNTLDKKLSEKNILICDECYSNSQTNLLVFECCEFEICIDVLAINFTYNPKAWLIYQSIVNNCGWIFTYQNICLICDRPRFLSFDTQYLLHAEGKPAIQYPDGFSAYAYHGVNLPEKYGKVHPSQWQAKWLLTEENAELRRVLTQGIGYSRICLELQATELDSEQEYTLLKIDNNIDVEPIYLLKMICPTTGYIHALRVPPDIQSAREAICWVNWGIDKSGIFCANMSRDAKFRLPPRTSIDG